MTAEATEVYLRNDVLVRDDKTMHRLLWLDCGASDRRGASAPAITPAAWLILLGAPLALPYKVPLDELHANYRKLNTAALEAARPKSELLGTLFRSFSKPPSAASLALSDRAFRRIEPLVDNPDILEPSTRHALLLSRSKESDGGTPKTLLKDLRQWWQGGQTQDALLGAYANCARPEVVGTAGRGRRKRKMTPEEARSACDTTVDGDESAVATSDGTGDPGRTPYQLTQADLDHMKKVIEDFYFDQKVRRTLTKTLQELHERHYTYLDGNGKKFLRPLDECPSYRQLHHYLHSNYSLQTILTSRKGQKRFAQEDRSTEGSIQLECHGVGHIYEFDATILDVPLVSTKSRKQIVGKPTLYLIIDRHSRLIVGWYLGFENANYSSAMEAILSIGQDKRALCRLLDIPYDPADWPAHGVLPESFLADQGALVSKKSRRIARSLRAMLSNVPGLRPDWKPLVE